MEISVQVPFSVDLFIALEREVPPEGVVMHVPPIKSQRDVMSLIVWDPITIEVAKFVGREVALPLFVAWLYNTFKNADRPPKITIRRREVSWDRGELKRAIEEEMKIEP